MENEKKKNPVTDTLLSFLQLTYTECFVLIM